MYVKCTTEELKPTTQLIKISKIDLLGNFRDDDYLYLDELINSYICYDDKKSSIKNSRSFIRAMCLVIAQNSNRQVNAKILASFGLASYSLDI
jgi:hypothetical protein